MDPSGRGVGRGCARGRGNSGLGPLGWNKLPPPPMEIEDNEEPSSWPTTANKNPWKTSSSSTDHNKQEYPSLSKGFIPAAAAKPQQKTQVVIEDDDYDWSEEPTTSTTQPGSAWKTAPPTAASGFSSSGSSYEKEIPWKKTRPSPLTKQEPTATQANPSWMNIADATAPPPSGSRQLYKDPRSALRTIATDAYKEVYSRGSCKLPHSYGQGVYEQVPSFVAKAETNVVEIDDYDWSDDRTANIAVNQPVVAKIPAGGSNNFFLAPGDKLVQCPYDKAHTILEARFTRHLLKCRAAYVKQRERDRKPIEYLVCTYNTAHHYHVSLSAEHEQTCETRLDVMRHQEMLDEQERENPDRFVNKPAFAPGAVEKALAEARAAADAAAAQPPPPTPKSKTGSFFPWKISLDYENAKAKEGLPLPTVGPPFQTQADKDDDNDLDWEDGDFQPAYDPSIKLFDPTNVDPTFYVPQGLTRSENQEWRQGERRRVAEAERRKEEKERIAKERAKMGLPVEEEKERSLTEMMLDSNETYHRVFSRAPYSEETARKGAIFKALHSLPTEEWTEWRKRQSKEAWTRLPSGPSAEPPAAAQSTSAAGASSAACGSWARGNIDAAGRGRPLYDDRRRN